MPPMTMLIWVTPPAITPGTPSVNRRRMSSESRGHRGRGMTPFRTAPITSSNSCANPAAKIPHAMTRPVAGLLP